MSQRMHALIIVLEWHHTNDRICLTFSHGHEGKVFLVLINLGHGLENSGRGCGLIIKGHGLGH